MSKNVGRNEPCPCGSGRKYKKCHGDPSIKQHVVLPEAIKQNFAQQETAEGRRQNQQGLGKPIISEMVGDLRFVAVGDELFCSGPGKWKTFHDFLISYLRRTLGGDWADVELRKAPEIRHPLLSWYVELSGQLQEAIPEPGTISMATPTGGSSAFLLLAYDLYLIAHNVPDKSFAKTLFRRLKNKEAFLPAAYEVRVAAMLIQAGFDLAFENEADSTRTHCEFSATYRKTGKSFSVEAKMRGPDKTHSDINRQLYDALKKEALFERIVFIELNVPDIIDETNRPAQLGEVLDAIRSREVRISFEGRPAPPAYVIITNHPYHYSRGVPMRRWGFVEGFKMPDFKVEAEYATLRQARLARDRHSEISSLVKSMNDFTWIPITFTGEIPEVELHKGKRPFTIGEKYLIPAGDGTNMKARLLDGCVFETKKTAVCFFVDANGTNRQVDYPLSDEEFAVYKADPTTFFGRPKPHAVMKTPLDLFDWLMSIYGNFEKQQLLNLLQGQGDLDELRSLPRQELAEIFCERIVEQFVRTSGRPKT